MNGWLALVLIAFIVSVTVVIDDHAEDYFKYKEKVLDSKKNRLSK